jgi:hypothetical protein
LRTGKKPHKKPYPKLSDLLPKDKDGKPIGKVIEVEYDVVDLPAYDLRKLMGGPVLRVVLGVLKKMIEDAGEDFPVALMPLLEMDDAEKIDVTKEVLPFITQVFAAQGRPLDTKTINKALKPILGENMIKTIFDEKFDEGVAVGKAEGIAEGEVKKGREVLLKILREKFNKVPRNVENAIRKMNDPVALDSWAVHAAICQSMTEFSEAIR